MGNEVGFGWVRRVPHTWAPDNWAFGDAIPRADMYDDGKAIHVVVELPGVDELDLDLSFAAGRLTIWGRRKQPLNTQKHRVYLAERRGAAFRRSIPIPVSIDESGVEATLRDGLLDIVLPKTNPARRVAITPG